MKNPEFELKIDNFSSRSQPHVSFTVAYENKEKVEALIRGRYEEIIRQKEDIIHILNEKYQEIRRR